VLDDFLATAERTPDKVAIVAVRGDGARFTLSFRRLERLSRRIALGLRALDVAPGNVVSYQLPNWWESTALAIACARIGAIANPVLTFLRSREIRYVLESLESPVVVAPRHFRGFDHGRMLEEVRAELGGPEHAYVLGDAGGTSLASFEQHFVDRRWEDEHPADVLDELRPGADDVAEIQFTSGTTGRPKGVVHTYNTIFAGYRAVFDALSLGSDDTVLAMSPMAHQVGFLNGCWMPVAEGMKVVYQDIWDPERFLQLVQDEGVTYTAGATPFMTDACAAAEQRAYDLTSLRFFKSGGSSVPPHVARRVRDVLGAKTVISWGMTENGVCTITRPDAAPDEVAATDGLPLPWVELKVTDQQGNQLPIGEDGLLWVRSASQCAGYHPGADAYAASIDADGFFNTGDLARLGADGSLKIVGRAKDVVIRGGENIPVLEVENALAGHPKISEVAVIGVAHPRLGEQACAVLLPHADSTAVTLDELRAYLDGLGMARQYWPEQIILRMTPLPRTHLGKVSKVQLRAELLHGGPVGVGL
jgi:cyclohexanecarboxylate-CoA ligase